jgi:hypothetical protein
MNNLNDEVYILVEFNPIACCLYKYKVFYDIPNEDEILDLTKWYMLEIYIIRE